MSNLHGYEDLYDPRKPDPRDGRILRVPGDYVTELEAKAARLADIETGTQAGETNPDTQLEDGEADLHGERQALGQQAPPDRLAPGDPYKEARRVHDHVFEEGGLEKVAIGAAINSVVNAAARGDRRVILNEHGTAEK